MHEDTSKPQLLTKFQAMCVCGGGGGACGQTSPFFFRQIILIIAKRTFLKNKILNDNEYVL